MRLECDPLADDAVSAAVRYHGERVLKCHELYSTIKELGETFQDSSCSRFLEFYEHEPPWNVDWEKCDSGRRFFVRNSAIAGLVLMYCSLVKSFTAAFGNKVSFNTKVMHQSIPAAPNPPPPRADPRALAFFFCCLGWQIPRGGVSWAVKSPRVGENMPFTTLFNFFLSLIDEPICLFFQ